MFDDLINFFVSICVAVLTTCILLEIINWFEIHFTLLSVKYLGFKENKKENQQLEITEELTGKKRKSYKSFRESLNSLNAILNGFFSIVFVLFTIIILFVSIFIWGVLILSVIIAFFGIFI